MEIGGRVLARRGTTYAKIVTEGCVLCLKKKDSKEADMSEGE